MFSFGEAVILTGMDSYSPDYQSEFWMQKAQETTQLEVLHPLCSSSQKFALGHSHTLLRTQTKPSHARAHLRGPYPFTIPSLDFLFATKFHMRKIPFGFEFWYDSLAKH